MERGARGEPMNPRPRRLWRRTGKVIATCLAVVLVLLGAVLVTLHTDWGRDQVRKIVVAQVGKLLNGSIDVGRLEGNLLDAVTLRDVVVKDKAGRLVLRADSLTVDYRILPLLNRHAHLDLLEMDGLEVELRRLADGRLAVADLMVPQPPSDKPPFTVTLADMRVLRSTLKIEREPGVWGDELRQIELRAAVVKRPEATTVAVDTATAEWTNRDLALGLTADLLLPGAGGVVASGVDLTAGRNHLQVPYATWAPAARHAAFTAEVSAPELARLWPDSPLRADARIAGFVTQDPHNERLIGHVFGGVGEAALNACAELGAGATSGGVGLFWAGVDPHELAAGVPAGQLDGWMAGELAGLTRSPAPVIAPVTGKLRGRAGGHLRGVAISALNLDANLARRRLTAGLKAQVPSGTASVDVVALLPEKLEQPSAIAFERADLRVDLRNVGDLAAALGQPGAAGPLAIDARASGRLDNLTVSAKVASAGLTHQRLRLSGLRAELRANHLDPAVLPGSVTGAAEIGVDSIVDGGSSYGSAHVVASIGDSGRRAEVRFDAGGRDGIGARGALSARLERGGAAVTFRELRIATRNLVWTGRGGRLDVSGDGRRLSGDLALSSDAGSIRVGADLTRRAGDLAGPVRWQLDRIAVGRVLAELGRSGVEGEVSSRGELRLPDGAGRFEVAATQVSWQGAPSPVGGRLQGELARRRLRAHVDLDAGQVGTATAELVVRTPAVLIDGAAWKRLRAGAVESVTVQARKLDLARLTHAASGSGKEPTDRLRSALADIEFKAGRALESGKLSLVVTGGQIAATPKQMIPLALDLHAELSRAQVTARAHADAGELGKVELEAAVAVPGPPLEPASWSRRGLDLIKSARVRLTDLRLDRLQSLTAAKPSPVRSLTLTGVVQAELAASQGVGSLTARVGFRDVRGQKLGAPLSGEFTAKAQPGTTELALSVRQARGPILDGALKVGLGTDDVRGLDFARLTRRIPGARVDGQLRIPDQPIVALAALVSAKPGIGGRLSGELTVRGTVNRPLLAARIQAPGFTAEGVKFERLQAEARYQAGPWNVDVDAAQSDGGRVVLKANGAADRSAPLKVHLSARRLRLDLFTPLWKRPGGMLSYLNGVLQADLDVTGTGERPVVDGSVQLREGEVRLARFVRPISNAKLDLTFRRSVGQLTLTASSRPGKVRLDGTVNLARLTQTRFSGAVKVDNLPVDIGKQLISIDGKISATGALRGPMWDVQLLIDRGMSVRMPSQKGIKLHDSGPLDDVVYVDAAGAAQAAASKETKRPTAPSMRLTVSTQDLINVRGEEMRFDTKVKLTMTRLGDQTSIDGNVQAVRGWVEILGRRYDIERAYIVFGGEMPPDPQLDIRVSHQFTTTMVYIDVRGRLSKPTLEFASDKGEQDQAQLLGLVLNGDNPDQESSNQTLSEKATGGAASLLAGQLAGAVRQAGLPVDVLQVGTDPESGSHITELTIGKWLTERLFVAFHRRFEEEDPFENQNEAVFEHFFAKDWMWEGTAGDKAAASLDLFWIVPL